MTSWEQAAVTALAVIPFFFAYLSTTFQTQNGITSRMFAFLRISCIIISLFSLNLLLNTTSVVMQEADVTPPNTDSLTDIFANYQRAMWYVGLTISSLLAYWFITTAFFSIARGGRNSE